jgi:single-strand DNA-binding protein
MKWLNKVQLIGYLGKDPEVKILPTGIYFATLDLATNDDYTKDDRPRETSWHKVKVWGKKSAYIKTLFIKGSHIMVDGKLVYRKYSDKDGITRYVAEIKADKLINLDR